MTRMDLEGIILSEISQAKKDKYCMISHSYVEYKKQNKNKINEHTKPNKDKHIETENRAVATRDEGRGGRKGGRGGREGGRG